MSLKQKKIKYETKDKIANEFANEFAGNRPRDNPPVQACALKTRGRFDDDGKSKPKPHIQDVINSQKRYASVILDKKGDTPSGPSF